MSQAPERAAPERLAFVNGAMVPESEAMISIRDLGLIYGECVFDTARTFDGRLFRMRDHVERLCESLAYARIDPGMTTPEILSASDALVEANRAALRPGEDYWVTVRVTAGERALDGEAPPRLGATVLIDTAPLPLRSRAAYFRDGIDLAMSHRRRTPPWALSPNVKSNNYLGMMLAQKEIAAGAPGAWALQLDENGDLSEGAGCNYFAVKDGVAYTPDRRYVLAGVSRQVVIEICADLGIPLREGPTPVQLGMTADEAFLTSTSLCACPVRALNGRAYPGGAPGPVTRRIMDAFAEVVGFDYVAQYLAFVGDGPTSTGL